MSAVYRFKGGAKVYTLLEEVTIQTEIYGYCCSILDSSNTPIASINSHGVLTIRPGYTWDGCSPKRELWGMVIGVPEGVIGENGKPRTYYPSLYHDALYQLSEYTFTPVERIIADKLFYQSLKYFEFGAAWLYYRAVRLFAGPLWGPHGKQ